MPYSNLTEYHVLIEIKLDINLNYHDMRVRVTTPAVNLNTCAQLQPYLSVMSLLKVLFVRKVDF